MERAAQGLPPKSMVYDYLDLWEWDGTPERIRHELHVQVREAEGREPSPSAAVVAKTDAWRIEIVKRNDMPRVEVPPKRWIVERAFAWINRDRRLAGDFERQVRSVVAFIRLAMIRIMPRRLATIPST